MSKFVDEIIEDLKNNPETFSEYEGFGVEKGNIKVFGIGCGALLSLVQLQINSNQIPTTYWDNFRLERAINRWYQTVSLKTLSK